MPIYTYHCDNCGVQFERRQKFSDEPLKQCPECEKDSLRKVYLPVGIVFKGSGFYSTDNRSSSRLNRAGKKSEDEGKSPKKETEKTEKKSEKKVE